MLKTIQFGNMHDVQFVWNVNTGNLETRTNHISDNTESFSYDNLNRLTFSQTINGNGTQQDGILTNYYPNGNIQFKSRIGTYSYDGDKLNAVDHISNTSGDISTHVQDIEYTPFNKTAKITEDSKVLDIAYGPDQQRRMSILMEDGIQTRKTIYSGNYEKITLEDGSIYEVHYLGGGAINVRKNGDSNTDQIFYVFTDHLGSIVKLTDAAGNPVYEQNFDAWGRKRNPTNWTYDFGNYTPLPLPNGTHDPALWLRRGFTGHEHLDEFALINMNGRVYDPLLGRMLSPDNFVQDATSTQGYNRYSYAWNNPLRYTDPTGQENSSRADWASFWSSFTLDFQMSAMQFLNEQSQWKNTSYTPAFFPGGTASNSFTGNTPGNLIDQDLTSSLTFTIEKGYRGKNWVEDANGNIRYEYYYDPYVEIVGIRENLPTPNTYSLGSMPTREAGGFIDNYSNFYKFMVNQARYNPVEVAAFGLNNGTYYIQPWVENESDLSYNNPDKIPGFDRSAIINQYHTHPRGTGLSKTDAEYSNTWNVPVHSISPNGVIWQVYYPRGYMVPKYYGPYGTIIYRQD